MGQPASMMRDSSVRLARLRPYNFAAGCLHLVQAVVVVVLANSFSLPVRATYLTGPPGPAAGHRVVVLFHLGFAGARAGFFALSALAHFTVVGPRWRSYQAELSRGRNPYRWVEYSLSVSIMIVLIAMLVGISDVAALIACWPEVNASMIGFGWMQERYEKPGWRARALLPGLCRRDPAVGRCSGLPARPGTNLHAPGFVYGIFFSLFVFFNCFALNQWLQYKKGRSLGGLPVRRARRCHFVPRCQEPVGLADLRLDPGLQCCTLSRRVPAVQPGASPDSRGGGASWVEERCLTAKRPERQDEQLLWRLKEETASYIGVRESVVGRHQHRGTS